MSIKESVSNAVMDKRTLIAILVIAILWRLGISLDGKIALWESLCSGIALFIMGWSVFAYILRGNRVNEISNGNAQGLSIGS